MRISVKSALLSALIREVMLSQIASGFSDKNHGHHIIKTSLETKKNYEPRSFPSEEKFKMYQ